VFAYVSGAQGVHSAAADDDVRPVGQSSQAPLPVVEYFPASHAAHSASPRCENRPAGQEVQFAK
jgi:hypothetical protein